MSYPVEAESDLEDDTGLHEDGFLVGESDDFSDEYEDVDFEAIGVLPGEPTKAKPGSEEKVLMLAARYAAGMPLWHNDDCTDHGPARDREVEA
ncbi:MAG: hypothetical protein ACKV2Q_19730 [Planctomycetaceae bacterium]